MVMHPVGPLPASTYWRRRVVLLVAVVLLLLVARSCTGGAQPQRTSGTPRSTPTPTPTVTPTVTLTKAATPAPRPVCADAALTLTTSTDAGTYAVGASPKITLTIKNSSAAPCRRDVGSGAVELLVFSGQDRVWSSDDCTAGTAALVKELGTEAVVKTWPGTRSKPGCPGAQAQAKPGTYRVVARVGTLRVEGAVFRIRA